MRLFRVELGRFRSRRAVVLIVLAAAVLTAVLAGSEIWNSRPVSAQERAVAEARAQADAQRPAFQRELEFCQENPEQYFGPGTPAAQCEELMTPQPEWYLSRQPLNLRGVLEGSGLGLILFVTALLIICGATYAGADWSTGSMSNQLLFEPRRAKVWATKGAAVLAGGLLVATVLVVAFWLVVYAVADARGITVPERLTHDVWWYGARGILLAGGGALGGYALTMLLRSTVGTLAVLFAYSVGGEALVLALPVDKATQWSLANNVFAWVKDGTEVFDPTITCGPGTEICRQSYWLGLDHGAVYLGTLLAVTVIGSLLLFRRRDIP